MSRACEGRARDAVGQVHSTIGSRTVICNTMDSARRLALNRPGSHDLAGDGSGFTHLPSVPTRPLEALHGCQRSKTGAGLESGCGIVGRIFSTKCQSHSSEPYPDVKFDATTVRPSVCRRLSRTTYGANRRGLCCSVSSRHCQSEPLDVRGTNVNRCTAPISTGVGGVAKTADFAKTAAGAKIADDVYSCPLVECVEVRSVPLPSEQDQSS